MITKQQKNEKILAKLRLVSEYKVKVVDRKYEYEDPVGENVQR